MNGFYRLYNSLKIIFIESIRSSICHPIKRFFCPYNIRIIRIIIYCIKVADSIMPFMNQLFSQIASYRLLYLLLLVYCRTSSTTALPAEISIALQTNIAIANISFHYQQMRTMEHLLVGTALIPL